MTAFPTENPAASFDALADQLVGVFDEWTPDSRPWEEHCFDAWARAAFGLQYSGNIPYRRYCESRGIQPRGVNDWREVPPVPTAAFRAVDLIVGDRSDAQLIFRTSGTTGGRERRGRHLVRRPDLYRSSLRAAFRSLVMPAEFPCVLVTLLPSFTLDSSSSLGWMLDDVRSGLGAPGSLRAAGRDGIDWESVTMAIEQAAARRQPVCVLGTTLSFAAWRERMDQDGGDLPSLVRGSRLMDTGGVKGRPGVDRNELMVDLAGRLGLEAKAVVNEFGMTELLSQRYAVGEQPVPLVGPPWLRTRILDPVSLAEVPAGESGIMCHFDLANLGSVCAVLTEDRGRIVADGIEWLGRTPGASPRGCSLATAQLLDAVSDG
jgi:hypothetical protein